MQTQQFSLEINNFQLRDKCQLLHILSKINNFHQFHINKIQLKCFLTLSGLTALLKMLIEKLVKK